MNRKVSEEDILKIFVEEMEARGENRKLVRLDIDAEMLVIKGARLELFQARTKGVSII